VVCIGKGCWRKKALNKWDIKQGLGLVNFFIDHDDGGSRFVWILGAHLTDYVTDFTAPKTVQFFNVLRTSYWTQGVLTYWKKTLWMGTSDWYVWLLIFLCVSTLFSYFLSLFLCTYVFTRVKLYLFLLFAECTEQTAYQERQGCEWRWNGWQWCLRRRWYY